MVVLKSYLTFQQPNGRQVGPNHSNTATTQDAPRDQWYYYWRDAAFAMRSDDALYLIWSNAAGRAVWHDNSIPSPEKMRKDIQTALHFADRKLNSGRSVALHPWREDHWVETIPYAYDYYRKGFYEKLCRLQSEKSSLRLPPFSRPGNFIRDLNDAGEFLAVKLGGYGALVHTGRLASRWANGVSGKSGGGLSVFWTPGQGVVILGRARACQSGEPDEWTDANQRGPYTWAVHAMTGRGKNGNYFSSARTRWLDSKYTVDGTNSAKVTISRELSYCRLNNTADPFKVLKGKVFYHRELDLDQSGVKISSRLDGDLRSIDELYEILPLYLGDIVYGRKTPMAVVEFQVGGKWQAASSKPVVASAVKLTHFGHSTVITFEKPQTAKLGNDVRDKSRGGAYIRNLLIELKKQGTAPLKSKNIGLSYYIRPGKIPEIKTR